MTLLYKQAVRITDGHYKGLTGTLNGHRGLEHLVVLDNDSHSAWISESYIEELGAESDAAKGDTRA